MKNVFKIVKLSELLTQKQYDDEKIYITPTIEQTSIVAKQIIALSTLGNASHNQDYTLDSDDDGDALVKEHQPYNVWDDFWE